MKKAILGTAAAVIAVMVLITVSSGTATASVQLDPEEQAFMVLLNDYRAQNGLDALSIDSSIQAAAEWMSTDMGESNYFSHTDLMGRQPWDRMCDFGYCYDTWQGENLGAGLASAQTVFDYWKSSSGHVPNMLSENYLVMGIAHVYTPGSSYGHYWTNVFGGHQAESSPPPAPTNAPGATPSPAPTPDPTATPAGQTPAGGSAIWGDHNCSGSANPIDSMLTLRYDAGLSANTGDCPDLGQVVDVASGSPHTWGDVDCSGDVTPVDSLKLLRSDAGLNVSQEASCTPIGVEVGVVE